MNQGPRRISLMEKKEGQKSRGTIPLSTRYAPFLLRISAPICLHFTCLLSTLASFIYINFISHFALLFSSLFSIPPPKKKKKNRRQLIFPNSRDGGPVNFCKKHYSIVYTDDNTKRILRSSWLWSSVRLSPGPIFWV